MRRGVPAFSVLVVATVVALASATAIAAGGDTRVSIGSPTSPFSQNKLIPRLFASGMTLHPFASLRGVDDGGATLAEGSIQRGAGGAVCGNGVRESGETCDGADLGGSTCVSLGFTGGLLRCSASCGWDTSGCTHNAPPSTVGSLRRTDRH